MGAITLREIAAALGVADPDRNPTISGIATLREANNTELSFLGSDTYLKEFADTAAAAVLVQKRVHLPPNVRVPVLAVDDADLAVAQLLPLFATPIPHPPLGIDLAARIAETATIDPSARVGPFVTIGHRSRIGPNCSIHAGVFIGEDVSLGSDCQIFPNVVIRECITIGDRVIIHSGAVLGSDGFGYRWNGKEHSKIPHIGTVIIEDDVEIGSCACIDRAKFSMTRVGRGTKIDNLVQIAHNCLIGPHCLLTGQAGTAGSVTLGTGVILGGQCAVRDHVHMADGSILVACSGAMEDVPPKQIVSGIPAIPHRQNLREQAALRRVPELVSQLRKLQADVEELKKAKS
jgi:UDP-3-O-[3-hydroxymyristoyl] glucosamine N-acyltransferase